MDGLLSVAARGHAAMPLDVLAGLTVLAVLPFLLVMCTSFVRIVVVLSLVVLALTVVVGHSGATAVWGGRQPAAASARTAQADVVAPAAAAAAAPRPVSTTASSRQQAQRTPQSPASPTTRPKASGPTAFSLADVRKHGSASSCWAAIDGGVYDLTRWIDAHPGGSDAILGICGTDATAAFDAQHGGQGSPARELAALKVGVLG